MKSFSFVVLMATVVCFVALSGCQKKPKDSTTDNNVQKNQTDNNTDPPTQYPELYTSERLPQYDKATIVSTGRQTTSLKDGITLDLHSKDSVQTIAKFYESELKKSGWNVPTPKVRSETMFGANCTKGNLKYNITITKMAEGKPTKIHINLLSK